MQYRPTAAELLADVADLLAEHVVTAVPPELTHRVRVAAHLCRLVERELRHAPALDAAELDRLRELGFDEDLLSARAALHHRLTDPRPMSDAEEHAVLDALLSTIRGDLVVSKPGYDR